MAQRAAANIVMGGVDELFGITADTPAGPAMPPGAEMVVRLPLSDLYMFKDHPYSVVDDKEMYDLSDTIKENGVLMPAIVRPHPTNEGGYEIVAGHRRKRGSELAGLDMMPCIIRELDDDTAIIYMVDSNNQRENVKPSERAKALKMKYDAMKRQGKRTDITSVQIEQKSEGEPAGPTSAQIEQMSEVEPVGSTSAQIEQKSEDRRTVAAMAKEHGLKNATELQRTMKAADLEGGLKDLFDQNKLSLSSAAELAELPPPVQQEVADIFIMEQVQPTLQQAQQIRELAKEGKLNDENLLKIAQRERPQQRKTLTLKGERLERFYTDKYTPAQFEEIVFTALDEYFKRQKKKEMDKGAR